MNIRRLWPLILLFGFACFATAAAVAQAPSEKSDRERFVREFLQNYLHDADDQTTRYAVAFVDLTDAGTQEVIVYLSGRTWCGSGGCTTLILSARESTYDLVTRITVSRLPIRVLRTKTNGWHDISIGVAGGGIARGYEAKLSFDGKTYPSNPSVAPAHKLTGGALGSVVLPTSAAGKSLY